ncbi:MAG: hypothetical protein RPT25_11825 [Cycloclasticus sp.]|jgi:hypothetical protein
MRRVGEHLEELALGSKDDDLVDLFGRSAFNRYYYSCYLATRKMLSELQPGWKGSKHSDIPILLTAGVRKKPNDVFKKMEKKGIDSGRCAKRRQDLQTATNDLAGLLKLAYDARVISDYEPEEPIQKNGNVISLRNNKLNEAKGWLGRTNGYIKTIKKIWKESGLV